MRKSFAFDFEYTTSSGLDEHMPVLQLTFAYTMFEKHKDRKIPVRRLKVFTTQAKIGKSGRAVLESVDLNSTMVLLTRKVLQASFTTSIVEARALIIDWLVVAVARYNQLMNYNRRKPEKLDMKFVKLCPLQELVRLVFGLLHNDVLQLSNVHPDIRIYNHSIFRYICVLQSPRREF